VFAVTRLRVPAGEVAAFTDAAGHLLATLRARPGFRDGELGRAADDMGRRGELPPCAVGARCEDRRGAGLAACARRTRRLPHRL